MIAVSETSQSRQKPVEFRVRGADDHACRAHVSKNHGREELQIGGSEVLYAVENQKRRLNTDII